VIPAPRGHSGSHTPRIGINMPIGIGTDASRMATIEKIAQIIISRVSPKYGQQEAEKLANSYRAYMDAHPKMSPQQGYLAWFLVESKIPNKLGKDTSIALGAVANLGASIGPAIGSATDFLSILTEPHLWIRVVEGIIAVGLLLIAANHLLGSPAQKIATTAAKVAA
jgi:hypothetical protein